MTERLYVGTYTGGKSKGIYLCENGQMKLAAECENPSYLIFNEKGTKAYAVNEQKEFQGEYGGGVTAFDVSGDGMLRKVSSVRTYGTDPCHLCLSVDERVLFIANYSDGSICRYELDGEGNFTNTCEITRHEGHGVKMDRQERAHVHFVTLCPWSKEKLWVVDLGVDTIFIYGTKEGQLQKPLQTYHFPAGYGPRHIVFHPQLHYAYVVQELENRVITLTVSEDGYPQEIVGDQLTLPKDWKGLNTAAAIKCSNDGKKLYISNRGHDSVVVFEIRENGKLEEPAFYQTLGKNPRDILIKESENMILCANQDGGGITAILFDSKGKVLKTCRYLVCENPVNLIAID